MPTDFQQLTVQQQQIFNDYITSQRDRAKRVGTLINLILIDQAYYNDQIVPIITAAPGGFVTSVIPDTSGLADSEDLDWTTQVLGMKGICDFIVQSLNTSQNQLIITAACGEENTIP